MTETENIVLEHLGHIRRGVDDLREDVKEVKSRLGILENQYASQSVLTDLTGVWGASRSGWN